MHPLTGPLLGRSGFRALWISRIVSFTGDGIGRTALVLLALRDGPSGVTLVLLANTVPRLLGPVAGALADRWERRRLMRACEIGQAGAMAVIALTLPPLAVLLVVVVVATTLATLFGPASSSSVPALVGADDLPRANALIGTAFNFQVALGPAIGGLAVGLGSFRLAFALDAGTFLVSALALRGLPDLRCADTSDTAGREGVWTATAQGLRYVRRTPGPRALVIALAVFVAFAAIDNVALVFLVRRDLGGTSTQFGLVQAAFGVGMLAASVQLSHTRRRRSSGVLLVAATVVSIIGTVGTAVAPDVVAAAIAQAFAGIGNGVENIALNTHVQRLAAPAMLGRVFGVIGTAAQVGSGIAYVGGAPVIAAVGARGAFVVAGGGAVLGLVLLIPALRPGRTAKTAW